jgi:anti-anti-sigma factor
MQLHNQNYGNVRVVKMSGRIDHDNAREFETALQPHLENCREGGEVVIMDFSDVSYISSAGFRVLLVAHRHALTHNSAFAVGGVQSVVMEIFAISRFDKLIACHPSVRDAIEKHAPASLKLYPG